MTTLLSTEPCSMSGPPIILLFRAGRRLPPTPSVLWEGCPTDALASPSHRAGEFEAEQDQFTGPDPSCCLFGSLAVFGEFAICPAFPLPEVL